MIEDNDTPPPIKRESPQKTDPSPTRKKKEIAGFLLIVIGLGVIAGGAFRWQKELTVDMIAVVGNRIVPANDIVALANIAPGSKMTRVELSAIRERILRNAFIKEAIIRRDLPGNIVVSVIERTPVAFINADELLSCDADGIVLPHIVSAEVVNLPFISGMQHTELLQPGQRIQDSYAREALALLLSAAEIDSSVYQMISEVHPFSDGELMIYTAEEGVPVMIGHGRIAEKVVILSSFWKEVIRPGTAQRLQSVDVRFQDQVVVRWAGNARTSTQPG